MRILRTTGFAWLLMLAASAPIVAQTADTPYGSAKFSAYADIGELKQLKVVWDFNFTDPRAVNTVFNYVNALLSAASEFGPHELEPIKVVVVSHGPELVVFARKNYQKYKEAADRAALADAFAAVPPGRATHFVRTDAGPVLWIAPPAINAVSSS